MSLGSQALIEDILAAHFTCGNKTVEKPALTSHQLRELIGGTNQAEKAALHDILSKCVKPDMIYQLFQTKLEQVFSQTATLELAYDRALKSQRPDGGAGKVSAG